jgi:hypothetical protein
MDPNPAMTANATINGRTKRRSTELSNIMNPLEVLSTALRCSERRCWRTQFGSLKREHVHMIVIITMIIRERTWMFAIVLFETDLSVFICAACRNGWKAV